MRINECHFLIIDTETTGLNPDADEVVEIAAVRYGPQQGILGVWSALVNPGRPIPPEASAVHGITDAMVERAPDKLAVVSELARILRSDDVLVAHNAAFDRAFLPSDMHGPWLCTYRLARHLWPQAPKHANQYLRYWLGLDVANMGIHRATADALVTTALLDRILRDHAKTHMEDDLDDAMERLIAYADSPIQVLTMPFGKHAGTPLAEVPRDYLAWALRNMADMDPDLRASIEASVVSA